MKEIKIVKYYVYGRSGPSEVFERIAELTKMPEMSEYLGKPLSKKEVVTEMKVCKMTIDNFTHKTEWYYGKKN